MNEMIPAPEAGLEALFRGLIGALGEDASRPGLVETPARMARAWKEWMRGYNPPPFAIPLFPTAFDGLVARKGIPFSSTCEHHLAHYRGAIDFGYVPNGHAIGISKIIRLFQHRAARLTIQEDLTADLVATFTAAVNPKGCIIRISALHACESTRGVNVPDVPTITTLATGVFKEDTELARQFVEAIASAGRS